MGGPPPALGGSSASDESAIAGDLRGGVTIATSSFTRTGDGWILGIGRADLLAETGRDAAIRLLPSGDGYWLLYDEVYRLLADDPELGDRLWTPRVWSVPYWWLARWRHVAPCGP